MRGALTFLKRRGPAVFGLVLLIAALFVVQKEFRHLSLAQIGHAMAAIPNSVLLIGAGWTVLAYAVLSAYDRLGSIYAGRRISWTRAALSSFCSYTLAHNLGFAAVSGAAVRYRFYSAWGLQPVEIAKVVGFTSLTYGLGAMALGGLVLVMEPEVIPWFGTHLPRIALQALAIPLWGVVATYIVLNRYLRRVSLFGHEIELPGTGMALLQAILAAVDVAVTAAIFYALLPPAPGLTYLRFVGIYLAAYTTGMAASVPGGIGVFDGAVLLGLEPYLPAPQVIGALVVFRLYYYVIPLFLAGALFAGFEIGQRRNVLKRLTDLGAGSETLEVPIVAGLVALAGALLIFLGALPIRGTILEAWVGPTAALISHFGTSVLGSLLLVMVFGLLRRLRIAWGATLVLLAAGGVIAWTRGEAWWLWGGFLAIMAILASVRGAFYRHSRLVAEPLSFDVLLPLCAVSACGLTLSAVAYRGLVHGRSWWAVVMNADAPNTLRFTVGCAAILLLVALVRLLRPMRFSALPWAGDVRTRLARLGAIAPPAADGALFGEKEQAGFAFLRRGHFAIALGDPHGDADDRLSAIWRFRDFCDREGLTPCFWRVGPELMRIYADIGLNLIPLPAEGGAPRFLACRAERDLEALRPLLPG